MKLFSSNELIMSGLSGAHREDTLVKLFRPINARLTAFFRFCDQSQSGKLVGAALAILLGSYSMVVHAEEDDWPGSRKGKHLLELAYTNIHGFDGDIFVLEPGYTYSYSNNLRFVAATQLVDLEIPSGEETDEVNNYGLGDSKLIIQYDPDANLTSSPWIPNTLGVFGALLLPTADSSSGLGFDSWGIGIGAGVSLGSIRGFFVAPTVIYAQTFNHGDKALKIRELGVGASILWFANNGFWLGVEPFISRDFELGEYIDAYSLVFGKAFANGLGLELRWGTRRRFESFVRQDDEIFQFVFNWQFGQPPGR